MYCTKCGAQNPSEAQYCSKCGSVIQTAAAQKPNPVSQLAQSPAPKKNKAFGCLGFGCLGIIVLLVVVMCSGSKYASNFSTNPEPKMTESHTKIRHGYFILARMGGSYVDFFESANVYCAVLERAAQEISDARSQGRDLNTNIAESVSGYHKLPNGTHVLVTGHESTTCGASASTELTDITVQDETSQLDNRPGVIVEGALIKQ